MSDKEVISDELKRLSLLKHIFDRPYSEKIFIGVADQDDAALINISETHSLVLASDFIRGTGFYLFEMGYLNYFDIGYYLVAANVSDIAAMGATPLAMTTIFRYTDQVTDADFIELFNGIKSASLDFSIEIVGGDTGGYTENVLSATAIGLIETHKVLTRKGAKQQDVLCITGEIGLPISALIYFRKAKPLGFQLTQEEENTLLRAWKRPVARLKEGALLSQTGLATSCQDISDGLKGTIDQISESSQLTFSINREQLPINPITYKLGNFLQTDPVHIALSASVDFQLLFTVSHTNVDELSHKFSSNDLSFQVIGHTNSIQRNILIINGTDQTDLTGISWKHQNADFLSDIAPTKF